jgi:Ca2+-binding EF-hand superfamily protein
MRLTYKQKAAATLLLCALAASAPADDKTEYDQRVAARLVTLFQALDRNADGALTREESQGDLDLGPRFAAIDINSDGTVTREELQRYIGQRYGVRSEPPAAPTLSGK